MTSEQASEIQRRMYEFIVNYMKTEGMPPTNREIAREMHIASTGHVDYHLTMLEKKGFISRQPKRSRGIGLTTQRSQGIPVMGTIAAGEPLDILPHTTESVNPGRNLVDSGNYYALTVRDHSMLENHICEGDYLVIRSQSSCHDGDVIVEVHMQERENRSFTLKRFFYEKEHDTVCLQPITVGLDPILIPKSVWDHEWQVQGKVVAIFRQYDNIKNEMTTSQMLERENTTREDTTARVMEAMREASDKLSELLRQKTTNSPTSNSISDKKEDKPEDSGIADEEELQSGSTDHDKELIKTTQKMIDLVAQQEAAYERISTAAKTTREQLNQIYEQGHHQAKRWFQFGLIAAIIGFLVILSGAAVAVFTVSVAGILTSIASIIPSTVAVLFFQQAKEANKRLDDFYGKLIEVEDINRAVELSLTTDNEVQDRYKGLIIFRLLGLHTKGQKIPILDFLTRNQEVHKLTVIKESSREFQ